MILALILFALIYILMLALPQQRPFVALGGNLTPSALRPTSQPSASCAKTARPSAPRTFCASASPSRWPPC